MPYDKELDEVLEEVVLVEMEDEGTFVSLDVRAYNQAAPKYVILFKEPGKKEGTTRIARSVRLTYDQMAALVDAVADMDPDDLPGSELFD